MTDPLRWRSPTNPRGPELHAYRQHVTAQMKCDQPYTPGKPPCMACAIGHMVRGWAEYAAAYAEVMPDEPIHESVYDIPDAWRAIGNALTQLIGPTTTGGLDAVSLRYTMQQIMEGKE